MNSINSADVNMTQKENYINNKYLRQFQFE